MNKKKFSLTKQAFYLVVGKFISFSIQTLTPVILVRLFSKDDYGYFMQLLTLNILLFPLINLSLKKSIYYFYPRFDKQKISNFISQAFYIPILVGIFLILSLMIFENILSAKFSILHLYILIVYSTLLATSNFLEVIFVVEKESIKALLYFIIDTILRAFFVISFAFYFQTVTALLTALSIYALIETIYLYNYLLKKYKISFINSFNKTVFKKQFNYSLPLFFSSVIGKISSNAEKIILIIFLTPADFAIYSVGSFKLVFVLLVYNSVGQVILPKISELNKNNKNLEAFSLWKKMVLKNAIFTIPMVIYFFIISKDLLVFLFTSEYSESYLVFRIILLVLLIQMLGHGYILRGLAKTRSVFYANLYQLITALALGYIFVTIFGIIGAAFLYLLTFSVNAIAQLIKSKNLIGVTWREFLPYSDFIFILLLSLLSSCSIYILRFTEISGIYFILLSFVTYTFLIFSFLSYFGYFKLSNLVKFLRSFTNG